MALFWFIVSGPALVELAEPGMQLGDAFCDDYAGVSLVRQLGDRTVASQKKRREVGDTAFLSPPCEQADERCRQAYTPPLRRYSHGDVSHQQLVFGCWQHPVTGDGDPMPLAVATSAKRVT